MLVYKLPSILITSQEYWRNMSDQKHFSSTHTTSLKVRSTTCLDTFFIQSQVWDPGLASSTPCSCMSVTHHQQVNILPILSRKQRNKIAHTCHGNRGHRGKGITCLYWNKGPSFLSNKQLDIETLIAAHKPHILGLGEANFRNDHDLADVQQQDYTLHVDSSVNNPNLGMARVAVYTHNLLRVKRRNDLEDDTISAVWLECGLPNQRGFLLCVGYRQWRLLGQQDSTSASVNEQLVRWLIFLEKWETAIAEDKEVIVTLDANIDFLTWRMSEGSLPPHHSSVRLKSLIDALFERIFPLGVSQLVTGATRMERGQPKSGLDHLYSNKPDKFSSIQTYYTGMSDHKLLKVTRFTKSFKQIPRYVRKRTFKDFDDKIFKQRIGNCGLEDIFSCNNVDAAAELLTVKFTEILDDMAPVRKIQTRKNYAPWLSKSTKILQGERDAAQEHAAGTDDPDDWRLFRSLKNQCTARKRQDKNTWEKQKLDHTDNNATAIWSTVKGWLGWGCSGTPTQLFWNGRMVTSPSGLASTMNNFFLDKIKRLRHNIPPVTSDSLKKLRKPCQEESAASN